MQQYFAELQRPQESTVINYKTNHNWENLKTQENYKTKIDNIFIVDEYMMI